MFGYLEGPVKAVIRDTVVLLHGTPESGVCGYRVHVPAEVLATAKEGVVLKLWIHLAVRETVQDLYGFETRDELQWFELLLTVSGIGPRSALSIMNSVDIGTLKSAIAHNDAGVLAQAFGIGRKTAEKIVLELREKVSAETEDDAVRGSAGEIVEALIALGYAPKEARDTARAIPKDIEGSEARLREALRMIAGNR